MVISLGTTPAVQRIVRMRRFKPGERNDALEVRDCTAGKSLNAAKVVHQLGDPIIAVTFLGGLSGQFIRSELTEMEVRIEAVEVAGPTRICITAIDESAHTATEFVEEPAAVTAGQVGQLLDRFESLLGDAQCAILTGSLAPGVPADLYARCIESASAHRIPVILDAQGEPLRRALGAEPMIVKPNRAELAATTGMNVDSDDALRAAIRHLLGGGPEWAVVTMGARGVVISDGRSFWRAQPPAIRAVNPIGSGDSFAAGLAVALVRGAQMPEAVVLASACGAANALQVLPGCIGLDDVRRLERQIRLERF